MLVCVKFQEKDIQENAANGCSISTATENRWVNCLNQNCSWLIPCNFVAWPIFIISWPDRPTFNITNDLKGQQVVWPYGMYAFDFLHRLFLLTYLLIVVLHKTQIKCANSRAMHNVILCDSSKAFLDQYSKTLFSKCSHSYIMEIRHYYSQFSGLKQNRMMILQRFPRKRKQKRRKKNGEKGDVTDIQDSLYF